MTPETATVTWAGLVASLASALALGLTIPSVRRSGARLFGLAVVVGGETVVIGLATGAARAPYLVDVAGAAAVVLILLLIAADAAGAGPRLRWLVPVVWGVVVLPATALGPLIATAGCAGTPCELQDFGGTLPLALAPAAFVLLAVLVRRPDRRELPELGRRRALIVGGVLWAAFVVWIAAMEGAIDAYTPTLLIAGLVGPAVGAVLWLVVDLLRRAHRPVARSLALGALAGIVATLAGAATVTPPWSLAVAALAGAIAAGVARRRTGSVARAGWVVLSAALVGLLAPVISGDAVGLLFTAQIGAVPVPIEAATTTAAFAAIVSLPVWLVIRFRTRPLSPAARAPRSH
jgi:ammonia channel protein AmtB